MNSVLLLALLLGGTSGQAAPAPAVSSVPADTTGLGVVRGTVLSAHSGTPLPRAVLELRTAEGFRFAVADSAGRYRLEGVPAGEHRLRALALDHAPLEVTARLGPSGLVQLDLTLDLRPIVLPPLLASVDTVPGFGDVRVVASGEGRPRHLRETELRALETSPGMAELGLGDAAAPPAGPDPDHPSVLYVRGAASDLKLVLLDGAPVYAPFHLGGLMDAFQPGVLREARLWVGGAPARFDGGISYVLDMRTRGGATDRVRTAGAVDLLGARTRVEGPVGPGSFLVGGRTVHGAVHEDITGSPLPYDYEDLLARVDLPLGEESGLSATGFWNREAVALEALAGEEDVAYWGNLAGSARWHGRLGEGRLELVAATGDFTTRLPVAIDGFRIAEGSSRRSRVEALYGQKAGPGRVDAGLSLERLAVNLQSEPVPSMEDGSPATSLPAAPERQVPARGEAAGSVLGAFADVAWNPMEELELRAGLRTDAFMTEHRLRIAPRLGASWKAGEGTVLSLAVGRFHQYVRAPETVLAADLDGWTPSLEQGAEAGGEELPAGALLAVVGASHLVLGLENRLREDVNLGLEAYLKAYDGLPFAEGLRSSGADMWLQRAGEHWNAWLGYSIGWAWTESSPERPTSRFAGRHLLSGGAGAALPSGLDLDVGLAYGSGLPFTPIPRTADGDTGESLPVLARATVENPEEGPDPGLGAPHGSYLRLDARLSRTWSGRLDHREFELTPYLKLLNALDRRDALFYHFDPERDLRPRSLAALPLLPVVGLEWRI